MPQIELHFFSGSSPALERIVFKPQIAPARTAIRGKTAGAYRVHGSFQWTSAVKALALCLARTKLLDLTGRPDLPPLVGGAGSLAASLDYALSKVPLWLADLFGTEASGRCAASRLFHRTNPERKRGGNCAISVNPRQLAAADIMIFMDGFMLNALEELQLLDQSLECRPALKLAA